jgi:hypothetical protein
MNERHLSATFLGCLTGVLIILFALAIGLSWTALLAWVTSLIAQDLGYKLSFWTAFGIWFLINGFLGIAGSAFRLDNPS